MKDRMKLSLPPNFMVFSVSSPVECSCTFLQFFFLISPYVWPNSGLWCCVFLTLRITLFNTCHIFLMFFRSSLKNPYGYGCVTKWMFRTFHWTPQTKEHKFTYFKHEDNITKRGKEKKAKPSLLKSYIILISCPFEPIKKLCCVTWNFTKTFFFFPSAKRMKSCLKILSSKT